MRTTMKCIHADNFRNVAFPCTEQELQILTDDFKLPNTSDTKVYIDMVYDNKRLVTLLSGQEVKLDELNYLMKRLDSFDNNEFDTFNAVANGYKLTDLKDLINLTFNTHCYSVVADFSDLNALGKQMYLTEQMSVKSEVLRNFDGKAYVDSLMASDPNPLITPYGIIYQNKNQPQQVYNGRTFPAYWYKSNPVTLNLSTEDDIEYLYLPVQESEIEKALQRLGADDISNVSIQIENHVLPQNIADIIIGNQPDLDMLNQFTVLFKKMGEREVTALSDLAGFAKIAVADQLRTIIDCMHEFETFPGIHTPEQYGRYMICESGHFEYDENLEDYIDFETYGQRKISNETGVFTDQGYLLYHGYNREMQNILNETLGMEIKELHESQELKLYMPLKATTYHDENSYGDLYQVDVEIEVYPDELSSYEDKIRTAIIERRLDEEKRGMMEYYGRHDTVNAKVQKYVFDVEEVRGELMGVAILTLRKPLNAVEMEKIKVDIEGQCSDGFGEGFEQQEINCNGKGVYVSLWDADDWSLQTLDELGIAKQSQEIDETQQCQTM